MGGALEAGVVEGAAAGVEDQVAGPAALVFQDGLEALFLARAEEAGASLQQLPRGEDPRQEVAEIVARAARLLVEPVSRPPVSQKIR